MFTNRNGHGDKFAREGFGNDRQQRFHWFWGMAFFRAPNLEMVFLHRQRCDGIGSRRSGNQRVLFFVSGIVWNREHTIGVWRKVQQIFDQRNARCDMYFMDRQGGSPGDPPARLALPGSPVQDVIRLCDCYSVLSDLFAERLVSKFPHLAPVSWAAT